MSPREYWLLAGEKIVTAPDAKKLTISLLCKTVALTKGSFYHHFSNIDHYRQELDLYLKSRNHSVALVRESTSEKQAKWFEAALHILKNKGYAAVTLEALITQMQVTKGAFYYLFESRDAFVKALLEYWGQKSLGDMHALIKRKADAPDTVEKILAMSQQLLNRRDIDLQIRAWALSDKHVSRYLCKLDRHQLEVTRIVITHLMQGADAELINSVATIAYLSYIGSQQIQPSMSEQEWVAHLNRFRPFILTTA